MKSLFYAIFVLVFASIFFVSILSFTAAYANCGIVSVGGKQYNYAGYQGIIPSGCSLPSGVCQQGDTILISVIPGCQGVPTFPISITDGSGCTLFSDTVTGSSFYCSGPSCWSGYTFTVPQIPNECLGKTVTITVGSGNISDSANVVLSPDPTRDERPTIWVNGNFVGEPFYSDSSIGFSIGASDDKQLSSIHIYSSTDDEVTWNLVDTCPVSGKSATCVSTRNTYPAGTKICMKADVFDSKGQKDESRSSCVSVCGFPSENDSGLDYTHRGTCSACTSGGTDICVKDEALGLYCSNSLSGYYWLSIDSWLYNTSLSDGTIKCCRVTFPSPGAPCVETKFINIKNLLKEYYINGRECGLSLHDCSAEGMVCSNGACVTGGTPPAGTYSLTVGADTDVSSKQLSNLQVTVNGTTKSTDSTGFATFSLSPINNNVISVPSSVSGREFSHFWDHDCSASTGNYLDISSNPYTFSMRTRSRAITAEYKTFTNIINLAYDGTQISGKLLDENNNPIIQRGSAHATCTPATDAYYVYPNRNVVLEYYSGGSWHTIITAADINSSQTDGSFSYPWSLAASASSIRATYTSSNWYYMSSANTTTIGSTSIPSTSYCSGYCGRRSTSGCWCDRQCVILNDCCPDYNNYCSGNSPISTPIAVCAEGERRCLGTGIEQCISGSWSALATVCQYGCSGGVCNPQPSTSALSCSTCQVSNSCSCTLSDTCNSGIMVIKNKVSTPISAPVVSSMPPKTATFIPSSTGQLDVYSVCTDPLSVKTATVTVSS